MLNGLTTCKNFSIAFKGGADRICYAQREPMDNLCENKDKIESYLLVDDKTKELFGDRIFLSSVLVADRLMDKVIDYVLTNKAKFMAVVARSLDEVGALDVRFRLSPVMLLHKLGLLSGARLVGGVYLDNDDVDLMVQEGASLVLTPTFDAGYGNGVAPVISYYNRGLKMNIGTADNAFNPNADLKYEAEVLRLLVNASMSGKVMTDKILNEIIS